MRVPRRSPLFSAIVLAGASLTAVDACGGTSDNKGDASAPGDAAADNTAATGDGSITADGAQSDAADASVTDSSCPPGSERETPPCALIR